MWWWQWALHLLFTTVCLVGKQHHHLVLLHGRCLPVLISIILIPNVAKLSSQCQPLWATAVLSGQILLWLTHRAAFSSWLAQCYSRSFGCCVNRTEAAFQLLIGLCGEYVWGSMGLLRVSINTSTVTLTKEGAWCSPTSVWWRTKSDAEEKIQIDFREW